MSKQIKIVVDEVKSLEKIKKALKKIEKPVNYKKYELGGRNQRLNAIIVPAIQTVGFLLFLASAYGLIIKYII